MSTQTNRDVLIASRIEIPIDQHVYYIFLWHCDNYD